MFNADPGANNAVATASAWDVGKLFTILGTSWYK
jgi:hypothetical protein